MNKYMEVEDAPEPLGEAVFTDESGNPINLLLGPQDIAALNAIQDDEDMAYAMPSAA